MKTSLVVPLYNEAARIRCTLPRIIVYANRLWGPAAEIIGVNDGSTDETVACWQQAIAEAHHDAPASMQCTIRLLHHPHNQGKGAAVRTGILSATGSTRIFLDADLSTPVTMWGTMEAALTGLHAPDVIMASRWIPASRFVVPQPLYRQAMSRTFNALLRWQTGLPYRDTQCGAKGFTATSADALFTPLRSDGFIFDVEVLLHATQSGMTVHEVPVAWTDQRGSTVHAWRDSWQMFWAARHLARQAEVH